jgi:hypothetical protein
LHFASDWQFFTLVESIGSMEKAQREKEDSPEG